MPKRSLHTWGVSRTLENLLMSVLSLPQVNSSIFLFLGFIIYCIVQEMSKIQIWRYRDLSGGRRVNLTAASFEHGLHGGGFDGCLELAGHTQVAHVDLNVFCCVIWLLNCYIKYFYKTIIKFLSLSFFFLTNLDSISWKCKCDYVTACGCVWKGQTGCTWIQVW